jgi:hypothetical protein
VKIELFKDAIAIIRGIPQSRINLDEWQKRQLNSVAIGSAHEITCGTIACAGGWLALYPPFQELGLSVNFAGVPIYGGSPGMKALAGFFDISEREAVDLFSAPDEWFDQGRSKTIWLRRADKLLLKHELLQKQESQ